MPSALPIGVRGDGAATPRALIFDVKRNCSEDGPGIRTTVFFKGCPLSCVWCHNPEGIGPRPELAFDRPACTAPACAAPCVAACPEGALRLAGELELDRAACTRCDRCVPACRSGALRPVGSWITLEDLLYRVLIDRPFFDATGGGVTLSGGEPTLQMRFVSLLLERLRRAGIHTALETCGFFDFDRFHRLVLPHLDLLYFDLKLLDADACRRYTGRSNRLPLANLGRLTEVPELDLRVRIPLVPGITDTRQNLAGLGGLLRRHGVDACSLMPYNPLWHDKLASLGRTARYRGAGFQRRDDEAAKARHLLAPA